MPLFLRRRKVKFDIFIEIKSYLTLDQCLKSLFVA